MKPTLELIYLDAGGGHRAAAQALGDTLATQLRGMRPHARRAVPGFTHDVAPLLRLADVFIGKPGPGCLSEALHLGLPVITLDNLSTMPQERFNTRWVRELGLGLVLQSLAELPPAVALMLERIDEFRRRVRWLDNRAVYEVPEILAELLRHATQPRASATGAPTAPPAAAPSLSLHQA